MDIEITTWELLGSDLDESNKGMQFIFNRIEAETKSGQYRLTVFLVLL